ncbi:hypothetical protein BJ508DRAFT_112407 [Ascobolus immersus RN42]|uniref:Uncharacterized protein n=1 Tax=Ascobolus immersus RN42 TaxID=1160509 RepID=A0A3N4I5X2_ASCIM|nr:hypothetical protein BJ508DRAFT_112407 [Ascobolus immersus RN42]
MIALNHSVPHLWSRISSVRVSLEATMAEPISKYTIGWICALELESTAAAIALDERLDEPDDLPSQDEQKYRFGRIGKHYIVIAVPARGDTGEVTVAQTAIHMVRTFRNLRIALMVGIGGGAPIGSSPRDLRLGDVVVGIPGNDHNGLLQHDFGKHIQDETYIKAKTSFNRPPRFICQNVTDMVTDRKLNPGGRWMLYEEVEQLLEEYDHLRDDYERPDASTDFLFPSEFKHPISGAECWECCKAHLQTARRSPRMRRERLRSATGPAQHQSVPDFDPVVHEGLIATGNTVIRDAALRDRFAKQYGVLCFEMEAAGLMNTLPCLVIRGISDYCDTHKSDTWQGYAALVATAYAKRLIKKLRVQQVEAEEQLSEQVVRLEAEMKSLQDRFEEMNRKDVSKLLRKHLPYAREATFNANYQKSSEVLEEDPVCLEGTRVAVLERITSWIEGKDGSDKVIFWLSGMAGMGKSTISRTIAQSYSNTRLLSSFFFARGTAIAGRSDRFVSTIAQDLASKSDEAKKMIAESIEKDRDIARKKLSAQWDTLVLEPLMKLKLDQKAALPSILLIIIDALDECEGDVNITTILRLLIQAGFRKEDFKGIKLRVLVTSRPELPIQRGFKESPAIIHLSLVLDDIARDVVNLDLTRYFNHKFELIRRDSEYKHGPDWPGARRISHLVHESDGLFVYASTLCRFLKSVERDGQDPEAMLFTLFGDIVEFSTKTFAEESLSQGTFKLYKMYKQVLRHAILAGPKKRGATGKYKEVLVEEYTGVIAPLVVLFQPITLFTFGKLLAKSEGLIDVTTQTIKAKLLRLRSVFYVPEDDELASKPVRILHTSFRDFILDKENGSKRFYIAEDKAHGKIGTDCLNVMSRLLKKDICGLKDIGMLREQMDKDGFDAKEFIPAELEYACRYWVQHFSKIKGDDYEVYVVDRGPIYEFLCEHLLHWLEVMILLKRIPEAILAVEALDQLVDVHKSRHLSALIRDAKRFLLANHSAFETAPLQLYASALLFAPESSVVREMFQNEMITTGKLLTFMDNDWNWELQSLHLKDLGNRHLEVSNFCISPDGLKLAATHVVSDGDGIMTREYLVTVWNIVTGVCLLEVSRPFELWMDAHDIEVVISPEGTKIITASPYEARVWNLKTGEVISSGYLGAPSDFVGEDPRKTAYFEYVDVDDGDSFKVPEDNPKGSLDSDLESNASLEDDICDLDPSKDQEKILQQVTYQDEEITSGSDSEYQESVGNAENGEAISEQRQLLVIDDDVFDGASLDSDMEWEATESLRWRERTDKFQYSVSVILSRDGSKLVALEKTIEPRAFKLELTQPSRVKVWEVPAGKLLWELKEEVARDVITVSFRQDSRALATGHFDGKVRVWQLEQSKQLSLICSIEMTTSPRTAGTFATLVTFSPDGSMIAAGLITGMVALYDNSTGDTLLLEPNSSDEDGATGQYTGNGIDSLVFSPNGGLLAAIYDSHSLAIYDLEFSGSKRKPGSIDPITTADTSESRMSKLRFSPNGRTLVFYSSSWVPGTNHIKTWDLDTLLKKPDSSLRLSTEHCESLGVDEPELLSLSEEYKIATVQISPSGAFLIAVWRPLGRGFHKDIVGLGVKRDMQDGLEDTRMDSFFDKLLLQKHAICKELDKVKAHCQIDSLAISADDKLIAFGIKWIGATADCEERNGVGSESPRVFRLPGKLQARIAGDTHGNGRS